MTFSAEIRYRRRQPRWIVLSWLAESLYMSNYNPCLVWMLLSGPCTSCFTG